MTQTTPTTQHRGRTPAEIGAQQRADAARDRQQKAAMQARHLTPAANSGTAIAVPDSRTAVQKYLDDVAPASIVGRMIKFGKDGQFVTPDDSEPIADTVDYTALCDQTLIGWMKFNGEGTPPDRRMGLLYDGFLMPERSTLGDDDPATWELGLDGKPQDPWQHHVYLVLQHGDTSELFTYVTSSVTGRRAIGNLLRHYDRMQRTHPDMYPVIKLKVGGFNHRDERVGWVSTPVLGVVGRAPKDSVAKPDGSIAADMNDQIPF
jgi:hypothetical protein